MNVVLRSSAQDGKDVGSSPSPKRAPTSPADRGVEENADLHAASDSYAARFDGKTGEWMLEVQEHALLSMLGAETQTVLDIGGGHGQTSLPLAAAHKSVTVLGSSAACGERLAPHLATGFISFNVGNLLDTPYRDRSFDTVVSFRLLSHSVAWRNLVAEMSRVAHHSVVVDYPIWLSINILSPLLFALKRRIEGNTRTFKLFSGFDVASEFRKHGFVKEQTVRQFFFPMALHRRINNVAISKILERCASMCGLTRLFGSPVITKFVRK